MVGGQLEIKGWTLEKTAGVIMWSDCMILLLIVPLVVRHCERCIGENSFSQIRHQSTAPFERLGKATFAHALGRGLCYLFSR